LPACAETRATAQSKKPHAIAATATNRDLVFMVVIPLECYHGLKRGSASL
jgi:hypothetical protein